MDNKEALLQEPDRTQAVLQDGIDEFPFGIFILLGAISGVLLLLISISGVFDDWQSLNPPPSRPVEFVAVSIYFATADPYIFAIDGNTYFCDLQYGNASEKLPAICAWKLEQPSSDIILEGCQQSGLKFWNWKKPFQEVMDCAEAVVPREFIGGPKITFVIDNEGILWYWTQDNTGNTIFYFLGVVILGALVGFLVSVVWNPIFILARRPYLDKRVALMRWEAKTLRLGGRIGSIPSLVYFAVIIFLNLGFSQPNNLVDVILLIAVIGGAIGLIISWRWEIIGGWIVLIASVVPFTLFLTGKGLDMIVEYYSGILLYWLPFLPGLFFFLAGVLTYQDQKVSGVE